MCLRAAKSGEDPARATEAAVDAGGVACDWGRRSRVEWWPRSGDAGSCLEAVATEADRVAAGEHIIFIAV